MNDLHNKIRTKMSTIPVAIGANATKTGIIIDRQGYGGVQFIASYGAVTTTGTIATNLEVKRAKPKTFAHKISLYSLVL